MLEESVNYSAFKLVGVSKHIIMDLGTSAITLFDTPKVCER